MRPNNIQVFVRKVDTVLNNRGSETIKSSVGNSVDNNRVPSVNQFIRFLTTSGSRRYQGLGRRLSAVYGYVGSTARGFGSQRTDAIDINELLNYLHDVSYRVDSETKSEIRNLLSE